MTLASDTRRPTHTARTPRPSANAGARAIARLEFEPSRPHAGCAMSSICRASGFASCVSAAPRVPAEARPPAPTGGATSANAGSAAPFRFHTGVEGCIGVLRRRFGLRPAISAARPAWSAGSVGTSSPTASARSPARPVADSRHCRASPADTSPGPTTVMVSGAHRKVAVANRRRRVGLRRRRRLSRGSSRTSRRRKR